MLHLLFILLLICRRDEGTESDLRGQFSILHWVIFCLQRYKLEVVKYCETIVKYNTMEIVRFISFDLCVRS